jgi:hypothetical protein
MRVVVAVVLALFAMSATPVASASAAVKVGPAMLRTAPSVEPMAQGCGPGWHRTRWRDRAGYWHHGRCVPN